MKLLLTGVGGYVSNVSTMMALRKLPFR